MRGIYINKPEKEYYNCDICESGKNVLEVTGEANCHEYGSCSSSVWICIECLTKVADGKMVIKEGQPIPTIE
ncbi:MAG: hypothetical protein N3I35_06655 [Clostridia bacterium]|nr:hypothetical protein [Clostridia bacterium]